MTKTAVELKNQGNSAFQAGEYEMAIDFFTQAIQLEPNNHVLYSNRAASYSQISQYEKALTDADKCIELNNKFVKGYSRKGAALFQLKRLDDARKAYEAGLAIDPNNDACREGIQSIEDEEMPPLTGDPSASSIGNLFANAKQLVQTHPKLKQYADDPDFMAKVEALQANPTANLTTALTDPKLQTLLSVILGIPDSTFAQARQAAGAAGEGSPYSPYGSPSSTPTAKPTATKPAGPQYDLSTPAGRATKAKDDGNKLYTKKDFPGALALYNQAIEEDPTQMTFYLNKAACLTEMANVLEKSAEAAKHARNEARKKGLSGEGCACEGKEKAEEAAEEKPKEKKMKKVKRMVKKKKTVQRPKKVAEKPASDTISADDEEEEAAPEMEDVEIEVEEEQEFEVTDHDDDFITTPCGKRVPRGACACASGTGPCHSSEEALAQQDKLYAEAYATCERALQVGAEHGGSYEQKAKAYLRMSNVETKRVNFDEAMKLLDKSLLEHRLDEAVKKQKELKELIRKKAEEDYLDPVKGEEARLAGNDAFTKGDFPGAIKFYDDSVRRNPKDVRVYSNRAACHSKLMNWTAALEDCEKAIALDPKFIKPYVRKGNVQIFLKQYPQAMKTFELAMEIDPTNADAQEGYRQLLRRIQDSQSTESTDHQQVQEAMKDPEIRSIMSDPVMQNILQDMQTNPVRAQQHLQNPKVAQALQKLMAAGIIKTR